jgi:hypothetical protein
MQSNLDWKDCECCGDDVSSERWALGYRVCLPCGELQAQAARESWTVVQEYGKGGYMFVTAASAPRTLRETNQKNLRS